MHITVLSGMSAADFSALLAPMASESETEGYRNVRRLSDDYCADANRFDRPGEVLFGAFDGARLIGVGGLNIGETADGRRIGRVRRLYVLSEYRRRGVGRQLMAEIMAAARRHCEALVLRTHNPEADRFYQELGFAVLKEEEVTHRLDFDPQIKTTGATP